MITIHNIRNEKPTHPWQVKVCRPSPLGNPFSLIDERNRDRVCDDYSRWFGEKYGDPTNDDFHREVHRLLGILLKYNRLELFCWCAPKRCHAETIKEWLENI